MLNAAALRVEREAWPPSRCQLSRRELTEVDWRLRDEELAQIDGRDHVHDVQSLDHVGRDHSQAGHELSGDVVLAHDIGQDQRVVRPVLTARGK